MKARLPLARAPLMSDAELIESVLDGEREFFQALVQRHQERLFRVAFGMVMDDDVAADLVQDAFMRAFANLGRCRDRDRFRVWLLATLRNRCLDYLREKRRRDVSIDDVAAMRAVPSGAVADSDADDLALRTTLETALAKLSPPLREAFVLRHVEQLTVAEAAEVLGIGESAVKMRVHRARELLRDWLAPDLELGSGPATTPQPDAM